ncbi:hypothetical protein [Flavobacterium soli]|uniref:hypothetical protein n=1 Tax=Flavobacterium soli TaxID=344881 RepID=UPI0003F8C927|nr:hypothetical protein [Flavobacterium soli]
MSFNRLLSIGTLLVPLLLLLGVIAGACYYRYLDKKNQFLVIYLSICLTVDIVSRIIGEVYHNNLIFIVIFSLLELVFFYVYYRVCFFKKNIWPYTVFTFIASVYMIYEMFTLNDVEPIDFQPYSKVICSFIIIIMSINSLFENLGKEQQDSMLVKLSSVFVIYFSLNLIFFLPVNFLINVTSSVKFYFWFANLLLTISLYTFLSKEIWKNGSTQKRLQSGF